jgi:hypothetical protein
MAAAADIQFRRDAPPHFDGKTRHPVNARIA